MKKLFVIMSLISTSLYLQAGMTPEQVTAYFVSGDFEREWNVRGYPYTPQQVEALVDRLVVAVSQPEYIEEVKPLINNAEALKGANSSGVNAWNKLLPLKHLTSEDIAMLHHFFFSLKQIIPLEKNKHLLSALQEAQPDEIKREALIQVRKDIENLSDVTIIAALAVVAGYHAIGWLTPEAFEYLNARSSARLNLKWTPLMLAMLEFNNKGILDKEPTQEEMANTALFSLIEVMARIVFLNAKSSEQYEERVTVVNKMLDDALTAIDDYRNQHQAA